MTAPAPTLACSAAPAPTKAEAAMERAAPYGPSGRRRSRTSTGNSVEQPVARSNCSTQRSNSAEQPAEQWTIWASREQVKVPKDKQTHTRPLSLPCTIDGWIMGKSYRQAQYAGHGQSKTVYRLTDKLVLKLCKKTDQEPALFQALQASGVYPMVHASCQCQVFNSAERPAQTWHAWVMDYAKPLDQILKEYPATSNVCILGAIRAMVTAHSRGHLLSDNALFNFGMVQDNVVIIDAGSRPKTPPITRGELNKSVMTKFWSKAQTLVQPAELEVHREQWRSAGWDMHTVLQTYQERWQNLCNAEQPFPVLNSLEVLNSTLSACPHVASVLDSLDWETLDWLTQTYLWDEVPQYGRSSDGYTRLHQDRQWTAAEKLEQLISETFARRAYHCDHPAEDILEEDKVKVILDSWKDDYEQWMRPETLDQTWTMTWQNWHQTLRKAFRSHLFQIVGSFEMVVFFIVAPFSNDHLLVFHNFANQVASERVPLDERRRRILELSKDYVRSARVVREETNNT